MYFLPWLGNTIVGSTDKKCDAVSSPHVTEDEIQYLVNEASLCLSADIRLRRSDVLSAWQGWRPLYRDPESPPGAPVSRHHAIGHDPETGVTFICGGKWSTYRAMAEELVDKVHLPSPCTHALHTRVVHPPCTCCGKRRWTRMAIWTSARTLVCRHA